MSSIKKEFAGLNNAWIWIWNKILNIKNLRSLNQRTSNDWNQDCAQLEIKIVLSYPNKYSIFLPNLQTAIRGSEKRMNKRNMQQSIPITPFLLLSRLHPHVGGSLSVDCSWLRMSCSAKKQLRESVVLLCFGIRILCRCESEGVDPVQVVHSWQILSCDERWGAVHSVICTLWLELLDAWGFSMSFYWQFGQNPPLITS